MLVVDGKLYGHAFLNWRSVRTNPDFLLNGIPFSAQTERFHPAPDAKDKKQELRPKNFEPWYRAGQGLACQDLATGQLEGFTTLIPSTHSFAGLMLVHADGMLYGTWSWTTGQTWLIEPGPAMTVRGSVQPPLPDEVVQSKKWEHRCFSTPVVYRGGLYLRIAGQLFCYDVRAW